MFRKLDTRHTFDFNEKPLLYEYYTNTLNPIIDRRGFDEIDNRIGKRIINIDSELYGKRFFLERSRILPAIQDQQQRQQVIIAVLYINYSNSMRALSHWLSIQTYYLNSLQIIIYHKEF